MILANLRRPWRTGRVKGALTLAVLLCGPPTYAANVKVFVFATPVRADR
jgi:hypothetical protein